LCASQLFQGLAHRSLLVWLCVVPILSRAVLVHILTCPTLTLTKSALIHVLYHHLNVSDITQALIASGKVTAHA